MNPRDLMKVMKGRTMPMKIGCMGYGGRRKTTLTAEITRVLQKRLASYTDQVVDFENIDKAAEKIEQEAITHRRICHDESGHADYLSDMIAGAASLEGINAKRSGTWEREVLPELACLRYEMEQNHEATLLKYGVGKGAGMYGD